MYCHDEKLITCFSRRLLVAHEPYESRSKGIPGLTEAQAEALDAVHFIAKKHELRTRLMKGDIRFVIIWQFCIAGRRSLTKEYTIATSFGCG